MDTQQNANATSTKDKHEHSEHIILHLFDICLNKSQGFCILLKSNRELPLVVRPPPGLDGSAPPEPRCDPKGAAPDIAAELGGATRRPVGGHRDSLDDNRSGVDDDRRSGVGDARHDDAQHTTFGTALAGSGRVPDLLRGADSC